MPARRPPRPRVVAAPLGVLTIAALALSPGTATAGTSTLFGTNAGRHSSSETFTQALARSDADYSRLDVVRVFFTGRPGSWASDPKLRTGRPTAVSFKESPKTILSGSSDAFYRAWFAAAPKDRDVWWTLWHEPEDDIAKGSFTATQYRDAVRRLDRIADSVSNPKLHTTMTLMDYTLDRSSHRNWRNYYAGSDVIDTMAWDVYGFREEDADRSNNETITAHQIRRPSLAVTRGEGKQFAIAELGYDDPSTRPAFLRDLGRWASGNGATYVTYFDSYGTLGEHRLLDQASKDAWRSAVSGSLFAAAPVPTTRTAAPALTTLPAAGVRSGTASLGCRVDPKQQPTAVRIASWTSTGGSFAETAPVSVQGGPTRVTTVRRGLAAGKKYTFRCKAYRKGVLVSRSGKLTFTAR